MSDLMWSVSRGQSGYHGSAQSVDVWDQGGEYLVRHTTVGGKAMERSFSGIGEAIDYARHYAKGHGFDESNATMHPSISDHEFGPL